jgi:hypothetical protein
MSEQNDRPLLEASLESAEVIVDAVVNDEVLKEIPVVSIAISICKGIESIRNRVFAAKLQSFVFGLGQNHEVLAAKYRRKIEESPEDARHVGETLFMILERLSDLDKADLLAALFRAYIDNVITSEDLRRMAQAVDMSFMDDLRALFAVERHPKKSEEAWLRYLAPSGLTAPLGGNTFGDIGAVYYEVTPLGARLQNAYYHGRKKLAGTK